MQIHCHTEKILCSSPEAVFDLIVDPQRFPTAFVGYGLIPAIRTVTLDSALAVGSTRCIENADGSILTERVTALQPPIRHAYLLSGFGPPFAWLVRQGEAEWTLSGVEGGTRVRWDYRFTASSVLAAPFAGLLLRIFMVRAMQRCLVNMSPLLASDAIAPAATG